jgi:hypothetical protein
VVGLTTSRAEDQPAKAYFSKMPLWIDVALAMTFLFPEVVYDESNQYYGTIIGTFRIYREILRGFR